MTHGLSAIFEIEEHTTMSCVCISVKLSPVESKKRTQACPHNCAVVLSFGKWPTCTRVIAEVSGRRLTSTRRTQPIEPALQPTHTQSLQVAVLLLIVPRAQSVGP